MSTALATQPESVIEYVPLGANESIKLTINIVRAYLTQPTRLGAKASDADCIKFMMLCRARELDPFTGDAFLLGYDTQDGPQFSLITAAQALFKRAERSGAFNGIQSGVLVTPKSGGDKITQREGDFYLPTEVVVGAWARVYRKDCEYPFTDSLNLSVYTTGKSRWQKDPAGMIVKCAEASCLRKAFPSQLGGMMTREEMGLAETAAIEMTATETKPKGVRRSAPLAITHEEERVSFAEMQQEQQGEPVEAKRQTKPASQPDAQEATPEQADYEAEFSACNEQKELYAVRDRFVKQFPDYQVDPDFGIAFENHKKRIKGQ